MLHRLSHSTTTQTCIPVEAPPASNARNKNQSPVGCQGRQLASADGLIQALAVWVRFEIEFLPEDLLERLVLAQGLRPRAGQGVQPHQVAVDLLVGRVAGQCLVEGLDGQHVVRACLGQPGQVAQQRRYSWCRASRHAPAHSS